MTPEMILYPIFAMLALTVWVGINGFFARLRAVRQEGLNPLYFRYNRGAKPPEAMLRTDQNYINLFELPVLFYVLIIVCYVTSQVDSSNIILAWLFVLSRVAHSYVHIRFNNILQRRRYFLLGFIILLVLCVKLLIQLLIR